MPTYGTSAATVRVDRNLRRMQIDGFNWHRQLVNLSISGHAAVPEQLVLLGYSRAGVLCALGETMAGTESAATAVLNLNRTELEPVFTGVATDLVRSLKMRLWNSSTLEYLSGGIMRIFSTGLTYAGDTGVTPVPPISATTVIAGKLAIYNGLTYFKNATDGKWYPVDLSNEGGVVAFRVDETGGIVIPGG